VRSEKSGERCWIELAEQKSPSLLPRVLRPFQSGALVDAHPVVDGFWFVR
jgi:hypothetical protein